MAQLVHSITSCVVLHKQLDLEEKTRQKKKREETKATRHFFFKKKKKKKKRKNVKSKIKRVESLSARSEHVSPLLEQGGAV
jgi:ATPase subunit of ABC transporter with duplicated ATPase domains